MTGQGSEKDDSIKKNALGARLFWTTKKKLNNTTIKQNFILETFRQTSMVNNYGLFE